MSVIIGLFICFFAINGLLALLDDFSRRVRSNRMSDTHKTRLVLLVKDQQNEIEGIVRNIISERFSKNLLVIDMGSSDETLDILKTFEKSHDCIEVLEYPSRHQVFSCLDE